MMAMHPHAYALDANWRTLLRDLGVKPANVLRRARLPDDLLQRPSVRLPPEDYHRFWASVEAETGDPLFPIRLCKAMRSESLSPPLFAALCSPNLLTAMERIARYKPLIGPMRLGVTQDRHAVTFELTWPDPTPPISLVMTELLLLVSFARVGTRETVRPIDVITPVLPTPVAPYEDFLGARIERGERHRVSFGIGDATRSFLTSNEPLWTAIEPELRHRLAGLTASVTTVARVRAALLEGLPSRRVSVADVAKRLDLSARTLQRRIEAEGTSFQQILRDTRAALARHYLERTTLSAAEIAFLLGFDEPNSFYRAFRAWTGSTPSGVRHPNAPNSQEAPP